MAGKKAIKEIETNDVAESLDNDTIEVPVVPVTTVNGNAPEEPKGVFLPLATAKRIYELYINVESADAHFHSCQSTNFRDHVRSVIKSSKIEQAFADLEGMIKNVEGGN